jgi:serine O-acetyltransferase
MNAVYFHRLAHTLHRHGVPLLPKIIQRVIFLLFNSSIPAATRIGPDSWFAYGGMGVVIHEDAVIGRNVFIAQQVTIGGRSGSSVMPVIEDDVYIAPGARILGPITVGAGAFIGANAVVIGDVPAMSTVGGIPAKVLKSTSDAPEIIRLIRGR